MVLFRSRLSEQADDEYVATDKAMAERVREIAGLDPLEIKEFTAEDGERLVVLFWENAETLNTWRTDPEHRRAQRMGIKKWYSTYELTVAEVLRTSAGGTNDASRTHRSEDLL